MKRTFDSDFLFAGSWVSEKIHLNVYLADRLFLRRKIYK